MMKTALRADPHGTSALGTPAGKGYTSSRGWRDLPVWWGSESRRSAFGQLNSGGV